MSKRERTVPILARPVRYLPKEYAELVEKCAAVDVSPFIPFAELEARYNKRCAVDYGLPIELLNYIFTFLDGPSLLIVRRVSTMWRAVSVALAVAQPWRVAFPEFDHFVPIRGRTHLVYNGTVMPLLGYMLAGDTDGFRWARTMEFGVVGSTDVFVVRTKTNTYLPYNDRERFGHPDGVAIMCRHHETGTYGRRNTVRTEYLIPGENGQFVHAHRHRAPPLAGDAAPTGIYLTFCVGVLESTMHGYITNDVDGARVIARTEEHDIGRHYDHPAPDEARELRQCRWMRSKSPKAWKARRVECLHYDGG